MKKFDLKALNLNYLSSIFIGENGGGKSSLLADIAKYFISKNENIITISNCVHDKLDINSNKISHLNINAGVKYHSEIMLKAITSTNENNISNLSKILRYCRYTDEVGVKITWLLTSKQLTTKGKIAEAFLQKNGLLNLKNEYNDDIMWMALDYNIYHNISYLKLIELIAKYDVLSNKDIPIAFDIYLKKDNGSIIDFKNISSGEVNQIAILSHIISNIARNRIILIDEPENSLHPKWQREYIDRILDLFHLYNIRLFVATHSPLIINKNSNIYEIDDFRIHEKDSSSINIEELLWKYFEIITPENDFLSRYLVRILENYRKKISSKEETLKIIEDVKIACHDEKQKSIINDLISLIQSGELIYD